MEPQDAGELARLHQANARLTQEYERLLCEYNQLAQEGFHLAEKNRLLVEDNAHLAQDKKALTCVVAGAFDCHFEVTNSLSIDSPPPQLLDMLGISDGCANTFERFVTDADASKLKEVLTESGKLFGSDEVWRPAAMLRTELVDSSGSSVQVELCHVPVGHTEHVVAIRRVGDGMKGGVSEEMLHVVSAEEVLSEEVQASEVAQELWLRFDADSATYDILDGSDELLAGASWLHWVPPSHRAQVERWVSYELNMVDAALMSGGKWSPSVVGMFRLDLPSSTLMAQEAWIEPCNDNADDADEFEAVLRLSGVTFIPTSNKSSEKCQQTSAPESELEESVSQRGNFDIMYVGYTATPYASEEDAI
jgi:hypothetical protein